MVHFQMLKTRSHLYMQDTDRVRAFSNVSPRTGPWLGATSEIHETHRLRDGRGVRSVPNKITCCESAGRAEADACREPGSRAATGIWSDQEVTNLLLAACTATFTNERTVPPHSEEVHSAPNGIMHDRCGCVIAQRFQSRASHNLEKSLTVSGPWPA